MWEITYETPIAGAGIRAVAYRNVWVAEGTRAWASGPELPGDVEYVLGIQDTPSPRLIVTELTVRQREGGPPITTTGLRDVPIPKLVAALVAKIWEGRADTEDYAPLWQHTRSRRGQGRVLSDDQLSEVAAVYKANPGHGTSAVAKHFTLARSTAGDYITRAREARLLED